MIKLAVRRWRNISIVAAISVLFLVIYWAYSLTMVHTNFRSGWALLILMFVLALYNMRKKLSFLPIGRSAVWLQFHLYIGVLTVVLFALHVGFRMPNGALEIAVALLFVFVAGSGLVGIFLSRTFARRLSVRGEEVIYERIPGMLKQIREEVEQLVFASVSETNSSSISDFYVKRLNSFFAKPRNFWWHLVESKRPRHRLLAGISDIERYLDAAERDTMKEVSNYIRIKDDLDYHYALQSVLKRWLFVHIPLTYCLILLSVMHGTLAYAFFGGLK